MALESLSRGIFRSLGFLKNRRKLDEDELRDMTRSLRRALQEADFNVRQTKEIYIFFKKSLFNHRCFNLIYN